MEQIDLTPLKGLHVMAQPSWWPLAYGWWVVIVSVVVVLLLGYLLFKWWRNRPVVYAVRELHKFMHTFTDNLDFVQAISQLMKRVAILKYGREKIAPLNEVQWQHFLVATVQSCFAEKEAKMIACSPYVTKITDRLDREKLNQKTEKWICETLKKKNSLDKE